MLFLNYNGYPFSICASVNEEVVHGFPSKRALKDGDIVSIDVGAVINGFHGDAARTFLIGNVKEEVRKLVEVTKECFFKGIEAFKDGNRLSDIGIAVQTYAESFGYGVVREMVEPMITLGSPDICLDENQWTVSTIDKKPAAHYENTTILTKNGLEILTL